MIIVELKTAPEEHYGLREYNEDLSSQWRHSVEASEDGPRSPRSSSIGKLTFSNSEIERKRGNENLLVLLDLFSSSAKSESASAMEGGGWFQILTFQNEMDMANKKNKKERKVERKKWIGSIMMRIKISVVHSGNRYVMTYSLHHHLLTRHVSVSYASWASWLGSDNFIENFLYII